MNNLVEKISNAIYNNYEEGNEAKAALIIIEEIKQFLNDQNVIQEVAESINDSIQCEYSDSFIASEKAINTIKNLIHESSSHTYTLRIEKNKK